MSTGLQPESTMTTVIAQLFLRASASAAAYTLRACSSVIGGP
jgi:hypothetical protein